MEQSPSLSSELKPFRAQGLVRRVTPFMGAGLVALVVFVDPDFTYLPGAEGFAIVIAASVV